jgi:hypothetical protein
MTNSLPEHEATHSIPEGMDEEHMRKKMEKDMPRVLAIMERDYGLHTNSDALPSLEITDNQIAGYKPSQNTLSVPLTAMGETYGDVLGEELAGHYLRSSLHSDEQLVSAVDILRRRHSISRRIATSIAGLLGRKALDNLELRYLKQDDRDLEKVKSEHSLANEAVGEFFGFLGRRLLHQATNGTRDEDLCPKEISPLPREAVLQKIRPYRRVLTKYKQIERLMQTRFDPQAKKVKTAVGAMKQDRHEWLYHYQGYKYAAAVDLSKINDWEKLFSLSNEEVRRRFFRGEPDYEGL